MIYKDPRAHNYYKNESGRSAANCPIDVRKIWTWLRDPAGGQAEGRPVCGGRQFRREAVLRRRFADGLSMLWRRA